MRPGAGIQVQVQTHAAAQLPYLENQWIELCALIREAGLMELEGDAEASKLLPGLIQRERALAETLAIARMIARFELEALEAQQADTRN